MAWKNAWRLSSYLYGTIGFGIRISKGKSVMDVKDEGEDDVEDDEHVLEVITDADYAGDRNERKSTTCFHVYFDGNLMESRVRSQKAISLSSGEFVAVVAGESDGLLVQHLWDEMTGGRCRMKIRSDISAARAMVQGQGIGRVRHLDASLWIQQKEK